MKFTVKQLAGMKFTMKQLARLLEAMRYYGVADEDDKTIIQYLELRLAVLKAEQETSDQQGR